jgi:glycosyltransferase involved in cell wall biosynthesis
MNMIQLSVALVTRNRPESLRRCLSSLRAQNVQPYEIVVSDDSDLEYAAQTKEISEKFNCLYITGPRRGLYANRNHAALACTGTHVRTMDDDHEFFEGHMERCLEAVANEPTSIWTTGEVGYLNGKCLWNVQTANQLCPSGVGIGVTDLNNNWSIADGSTIYPKVIFEKGLRMVEEYGYGSSYLEFGAYLYQNGFRSRCIENEKIIHHVSTETLKRDSYKAIVSRLFASLCFNLHFKKSNLLAAKYAASYSYRLLMKQKLSLLPSVMSKVHQRWSEVK